MNETSKPLRVALPLGIGDAWWCATKFAALSAHEGGRRIHAFLHRSPYHPNTDQYLTRLPAISEVTYSNEAPSGGDGGLEHGYRDRHWEALENCRNWRGFDYVMLPNGALERGLPLEEWLPELETDRMVRPAITGADYQTAQLAGFRAGNLMLVPGGSFANRGWHRHRWAPRHWAALIRGLNGAGISPALLGSSAPDEHDYLRHIRLADHTIQYVDLYGKLPITAALAAVASASMVIGRASGLTINAVVLGTPSVLLWPDDRYPIVGVPTLLHLNHRMQTSWVPPGSIYRPLAYGDPALTPELLAGLVVELAPADRSVA